MSIDFTKGARFIVSTEMQTRKLLSILINMQRVGFFPNIAQIEQAMVDFAYSDIGFIDVRHYSVFQELNVEPVQYGIIATGKRSSELPEGITDYHGTNSFIIMNAEFIDGHFDFVSLSDLADGSVARTPNQPIQPLVSYNINRHPHADLIEWYFMDDRNEVEVNYGGGGGRWITEAAPSFDPDSEYRRKVYPEVTPKPRHNWLAATAYAHDTTIQLEYRTESGHWRTVTPTWADGVLRDSADYRIVDKTLDERVAQLLSDHVLSQRLAEHFKAVS